jgi:hypothetical protein
VRVIEPPPWPWWPITFTTVCVVATLFLYTRARRNGRPFGVQSGIVGATVALFAIPVLTVIGTQDMRCGEDGVVSRSDLNLAVISLTMGVVLVALWGLALAAGEPPRRAWRLPAVLLAALVPAGILEALISIVALDSYCDAGDGLLQAQLGAAVVLPVVVGLALARGWRSQYR